MPPSYRTRLKHAKTPRRIVFHHFAWIFPCNIQRMTASNRLDRQTNLSPFGALPFIKQGLNFMKKRTRSAFDSAGGTLEFDKAFFLPMARKGAASSRVPPTSH